MLHKDNKLILPQSAKPRAQASKGFRVPKEDDFALVPVYTFLRNVKCPEIDCHTGTLQFNGMAYPSTPPRYQHQCTACGCLYDLPQQFPIAQYAPIPKPPKEEVDRHDGG